MKNTIDELDIVALTKPLPDHRLARGDEGTVVMIYGDHAAYEVEFFVDSDSPYTKAIVTLPPDAVRLVQKVHPASPAITAD